MTIATDLDWVQSRLHDSGNIWTRAELLRWYNDGVRELITKSGAVKRMTIIDVPGRVTYSHMFEWESQMLTGTTWMYMLPSYHPTIGKVMCMYQWEVEHNAGVTPTNSNPCVTQQWERAYISSDVDRNYYFYLPRDHQHIDRVAWDDQRLEAQGIIEMDALDIKWDKTQGDPLWWSPGTGRSRTVEVFYIKTNYTQAYALKDYWMGMPGLFQGRTYAIKGTSGGTISGISSPDRQYLPVKSLTDSYLGIPYKWQSSVDSLTITETVLPDRDLGEDEAIDYLSSRLIKYLRYFTLYMALGRIGEGYNPKLSDHYKKRFDMGITVLKRFSNLAHRGRTFSRYPVTESNAKPPRPQLPSFYPRQD